MKNQADHLKIISNTGIKPCSSLISNKMAPSAQMTANDFIKTNRLKQWNPYDPIYKSSDSNFEYCYFNHDMDNSLSDYTITAGECHRNNPTFQHRFVADVFEDNKPETAYQAPFNKCIVKVDKTNVTTDDLNSFWRQLGNQECTQLATEAIATRDYLSNQLNICSRHVNAYEWSNNELSNMIVKEQWNTVSIIRQIDVCEREKAIITSNINSNIAARNDVLSNIYNINKICTAYQARLQNSIHTNSNNYHVLLPKFQKNEIQLKFEQENLTSLMDGLSILETNYAKTYVSLNSNLNTFYHLKTEIINTSSNIAVCSNNLLYAIADLQDCETNYAAVLKELSLQNDRYFSCANLTIQCNGKKEICRTDTVQVKEKKARLEASLVTCTQELEECRKKVALLMAENNALTLEIKETLRLIDIYCKYSDHDKTRASTLSSNMNAILANSSNNLVSLKTDYIVQNAASKCNIDNRANSCAADTSTIMGNVFGVSSRIDTKHGAAFSNVNSAFQSMIDIASTFNIFKHWITCPKGYMCPICDKQQASTICPQMCQTTFSQFVDADWTGDYKSLSMSNAYCACSYTGKKSDEAKAKASAGMFKRIASSSNAQSNAACPTNLGPAWYHVVPFELNIKATAEEKAFKFPVSSNIIDIYGSDHPVIKEINTFINRENRIKMIDILTPYSVVSMKYKNFENEVSFYYKCLRNILDTSFSDELVNQMADQNARQKGAVSHLINNIACKDSSDGRYEWDGGPWTSTIGPFHNISLPNNNTSYQIYEVKVIKVPLPGIPSLPLYGSPAKLNHIITGNWEVKGMPSEEGFISLSPSLTGNMIIINDKNTYPFKVTATDTFEVTIADKPPVVAMVGLDENKMPQIKWSDPLAFRGEYWVRPNPELAKQLPFEIAGFKWLAYIRDGKKFTHVGDVTFEMSELARGIFSFVGNSNNKIYPNLPAKQSFIIKSDNQIILDDQLLNTHKKRGYLSPRETIPGVKTLSNFISWEENIYDAGNKFGTLLYKTPLS